MSVNFQPLYGVNPTSGKQEYIQTDGNHNLASTPASGSALSIQDHSTPTNFLKINANGSAQVQPLSITASTATLSNVTSTISSTTLLAANANRLGAFIYNDSTAILYVAYAGTATTTAYTTQVPSQALFELPTSPDYTGIITGVWAAANGAARVTELTA